MVIDNIPFITAALPSVTTFPIDYNLKYYIIATTFSLVTTYLAGWFPARKASKVDRWSSSEVNNMESNTVIKTLDIVKYFTDPVPVKVLNDVSFQIQRGEFTSIVGKSGCGKSTLLYILSTMDTDYKGQLWIGGEDMKIKNQRACFGEE